MVAMRRISETTALNDSSEKIASKLTAALKIVTKQPPTKQPPTNQPPTNQPTSNQATNQATTNQPTNKQPSNHQPTTNQPSNHLHNILVKPYGNPAPPVPPVSRPAVPPASGAQFPKPQIPNLRS